MEVREMNKGWLLTDEEIRICRTAWQHFINAHGDECDTEACLKHIIEETCKAQLTKAEPLIRADERIECFAKLCNVPLGQMIAFDWALSKQAVNFLYMMQGNPECKKVIWDIITGKSPAEEEQK